MSILVSRSVEEIEIAAAEIIDEVKKARSSLVKIQQLLEKSEATQTIIYSLDYVHGSINCLDEAFCHKVSKPTEN